MINNNGYAALQIWIKEFPTRNVINEKTVINCSMVI